MPLRTIDPVIVNRRYPASSTPPLNPIRGYFWTEIDGNSDLVQEWFWNGNYWLSTQTFEYQFVNTSFSASAATVNRNKIDTAYSLWFVRSFGTFLLSTLNDSSNYWTFNLFSPPVSDPLLFDSRPYSTLGAFLNFSIPFNLFIPLSTLTNSSHRRMQAQVTKTGSPGNIEIFGGLIYRYAR